MVNMRCSRLQATFAKRDLKKNIRTVKSIRFFQEFWEFRLNKNRPMAHCWFLHFKNWLFFQEKNLTSPKFNIDTQTWWFGKCISGFKYGIILGIDVLNFSEGRSFSYCLARRPPESSSTIFQHRKLFLVDASKIPRSWLVASLTYRIFTLPLPKKLTVLPLKLANKALLRDYWAPLTFH